VEGKEIGEVEAVQTSRKIFEVKERNRARRGYAKPGGRCALVCRCYGGRLVSRSRGSGIFGREKSGKKSDPLKLGRGKRRSLGETGGRKRSKPDRLLYAVKTPSRKEGLPPEEPKNRIL